MSSPVAAARTANGFHRLQKLYKREKTRKATLYSCRNRLKIDKGVSQYPTNPCCQGL
jgi:hypothetical protein